MIAQITLRPTVKFVKAIAQLDINCFSTYLKGNEKTECLQLSGPNPSWYKDCQEAKKKHRWWQRFVETRDGEKHQAYCRREIRSGNYM